LNNPDEADAKHIQAIIIKDASLVSMVLRMANSSYFSNSAQCSSVSEAVVRLGFREVYRITVGSVAGRWLKNSNKGYGWEPGDLCKHSLCVAVATEYLAKGSNKVDSGLAYTAGLLHDVGKLALAHACAEQFELVRARQAELRISWRQAEHDILGYDHTDVGGALMESWSYPPNLIQVARYYPRPKLSAEEFRSLVVHVHAGKHIALSLGYGVGEEGFSTELDEESLKEEGFTAELLEKSLPPVLEGSNKLITGAFS